MGGENVIGRAMMGLLRGSTNPVVRKIGGVAKAIAPTVYQTASDLTDAFFDPEKLAMEYYAKEFNPSPKQIESLQDVKDFIGGFSSVPMAPPFLGRGQTDRGYVPETKFTLSPWGMSSMSAMGNMYDPYLEGAVKHNAGMRAYEQSENQANKRPFDDWAKLHEAVQNRHARTIELQAALRKDPKIIAAAKGDPKIMAKLIQQRTAAANKDGFNAGDYLRFTLMNEQNPNFGSMKIGTTQAHSLELPDMTGRRPYIIR
jgi:hypothetical protein